MFGIKIKDEFVDFPESGKLTFELNLGSFDDEIIPGSISFPANFPATDKNRRIFSNDGEIDIVAKGQFYEGVFYAFGAPFDRCKILRLESDKDVFRMSVILHAVSLDIEGKTLKSIDTTSINKSFTTLTELFDYIRSCRSIDSDEAIFFPRIRNDIAFQDIEDSTWISDHYDGIINRWTDPNIITPYAKYNGHDNNFPRYILSPMIKEIKILEMLFQQYGYRVTGSFINNKELRNNGIYSDRVVKCDVNQHVQISQTSNSSSSPKVNHFLNLGLNNPMDADYLNAVDIHYNVSFDFTFPTDQLKIKIDKNKPYKVGFKCSAFLDFAFVTIRYVFIQEDPSNPGDGMYAYFLDVPTFVQPNEDSLIIDSRIFDFSSGFDDLEDELYLVAFLKNTLETPSDWSIGKASLQVVEIGAEDIDTTINVSEFLPSKPIDEWLTGLKTNYNLRFYFDPFSKEVIINHKEDDLKLTSETIDSRVGDQIPLKTLDNNFGYNLSYNFESLDDEFLEDNIVEIDTNQIAGYSPEEGVGNGQYYIEPQTGRVFFYLTNGVTGSYSFVGYYYQGQIIGDGSKSIEINGRAPLLMEIDAVYRCLQPVISKRVRHSGYGLNADEFTDCRLAINRGLAPNTTDTLDFPTASSLSIAADGTTSLGNIELWFALDRPQSLYSLYMKRWFSFLRTTERFRDNIIVDLPFLQKFFSRQMKLRNTLFLQDRLTFTISDSEILEAEIEMYKNNLEYEPTK